MPEGRLQRTREGKPEIPPCVRLGHAWNWHHDIADHVCIRCGIVGTQLGYWTGVPERRASLAAVSADRPMLTINRLPNLSQRHGEEPV